MPRKKHQPSKKNPAVTTELRGRCKAYLEETHYSEWKFTDFWKGENLSGYGEVWLRALMSIIRTTDNNDKRIAAVEAKDKYKNGEHQVRSKQVVKRSKESQKLDRPELPPSYQSSQSSKERESSPEDETPENETPAGKLSSHEMQYRALSPDRKWYLPSGKCVEDVLFALAVSQSEEARRLKQIPKESYAHSYILDVDSPVIQAEFKEDWDYIISLLLPLPEVEDSLVSFMHKFADVKTAAGLRDRIVATTYVPSGETYSGEKHGDQAWVHSVLASFIVLYELGHMPRTKNLNLEAWFQINIWGPIFDRCFQYIPKMTIARSESQSPCNSDRKNSASSDRKSVTNSNLNVPTKLDQGDSTSTNTKDLANSDEHDSTSSNRKSPPMLDRKVIGSKYDGLITHNQIEYGAVEDSKQFDSETSKKWVSDSLKLAKVLHDQLRGLEGKVKHDREALGKFRCVGFLTGGLHCQGLYLQYGKGHVSLLQRSATCEVQKDVSPMSSLISVLVMVWQMRETVRRSIYNLEEFIDRNAEMLFQMAVKQLPPLPAILPICFDTDGEF